MQFLKNFELELKLIKTKNQLNILKIKYLGKKGLISNYIKEFKILELEKRKYFLKKINYVKKYIKNIFDNERIKFDNLEINKKNRFKQIDISLPGRKKKLGAIHPITSFIYYIESIFSKFGFNIIKNGFEIEHQYYNFDALNIPISHPARNMQDTFWFNSDFLLRTQTSNMQIHEIKKKKLPIKIIVPGKVYRKDYDQTHSPMFYQIEGLIIDKNINFSHLKWIINIFLDIFFNKKMKIRFRSSYFPFTILSSEVDVMDENNTWLEILGCGMVHPNILKRFNIDINIYSGFAFGMGVERMIMLYYGINDLRLFLKNDLRFLKQFKKNRYF
ncbi:phenylalanine--tRNA ligase subunit alpha [Buchnera aphidicola (Therioaphis trifolii)]|uniref:Phenylalanine--tRNA ligase alpha subunit n=1 Tax=Buchnera aphidicola (Therioaphis trifolii) TaxID=1241884 RepID=A0A4D6YMH4_9GAMM|nr:phenylalanine--tRNA ligase subunit alpha [Buchnera aphidicola (Therioaphis trifolii)]